MERVVVFRNGSIGNTLVAVPLMRALGRALKKSGDATHLCVVVDPVGGVLLAGLPFIDELIIYDKKGEHRGVGGFVRLVARLRRGRYDTAVMVKRFFRNELIAFLAGIPKRVGYLTPGVKPFGLTGTAPYVEGKNIVDLNLDLLTPLGLEAAGDHLELQLGEGDRAIASQFIEANGLVGSRFIVCHFGGATMGEGKWDAMRCAKLCSLIISGHDYDLVLPATADEVEFARNIVEAIELPQGRKVVVAPGLPLKALTALIDEAHLFVGNDSGPSHLADVVRTPSVILFGKANGSNGGVEEQIAKWKPKGDLFMAAYSPKGELSHLSAQEAYGVFKQLVELVSSRAGQR